MKNLFLVSNSLVRQKLNVTRSLNSCLPAPAPLQCGHHEGTDGCSPAMGESLDSCRAVLWVCVSENEITQVLKCSLSFHSPPRDGVDTARVHGKVGGAEGELPRERGSCVAILPQE